MNIINGYFHFIANDIIHRDLKPDNILCKNNIYKIADLSWSCYVDDNKYEEAGTPIYMVFLFIFCNIIQNSGPWDSSKIKIQLKDWCLVNRCHILLNDL